MANSEHIEVEPGSRDAWVCICKNTPDAHGFYPCDAKGKEMEPIAGIWDDLYVCGNCGRIINQNTLQVIGHIAAAENSERG